MVQYILRKIYISKINDPAFNLAFEEKLVKTANNEDFILYLWQNENTVVIGRNQNPWKECHWKKLQNDGGKLIRRLSGGGAVYHDHGNLNFTFVSKNSDNKVEENIKIIIDALKSLRVNAYFSGKNDILVDGRKISGNAYFTEGEILCHHGTLLVDANITKLSDYLKVSELKLKSKGIDSVKSRVINLKDIDKNLTVDTIKKSIIETFYNVQDYKDIHYIDKETELKFNNLIEKYNSWDWNFGSSPQFDIQLSNRFNWGEVDLNFHVDDGIVKDIRAYSDSNDPCFSQKIESNLKGIKFEKKDFLNSVNNLQDERKIDIVRWLENIDF